ncbi:TreTu family toxin [Embleya sp. NPDC055664]
MGRTTAQVFSSKAIEQWRTTTTYAGADETRVTPPNGGTATLSINDARGKPKELREYNGGKPEGDGYTKITYTYTPREELKTVTDAGGNTWTYTYDFLGRRTHVEVPDKGPSDTRYDLVGRVIGTTDARGQKLAYTYDALGRKTASYKDTVADANLLAEWTYDRYAKGQADGSSRYVGGKSGAKYTSEITGFEPGTYRPAGTRTTIPAAEGKLAGVYTTSTKYEPRVGLPVSTKVPAHGGLPAETLLYGHNDAGLLTELGGATFYLSWAEYDPYGRNTLAVLGAEPLQPGFTSAYDPATGRLLSTEWQKPGVKVDATSYTYKPNGDVTSIKTVRDGTTTDTQCFAYDSHRRLKEAWTDTAGTDTPTAPRDGGLGACTTQTPTPSTVGGPDPYWQTFTYDVVGNRTKLVDHDPTDDPTKNVTTEYGYRAGTTSTDRTHRLDTVTVKTGTREAVTTGLTYDPSGNTKTRPGADANVQTLTWNEEDKLTKVASATGTGDYVYDADGNRIIRREAGKTTLYLGSDELTTNTDQSGPVVGTRYYQTAGGAAVVRNGNGMLVYVAVDHHGTPTSTLDATTLTATRRQSKPFGEPRGPQPTQAGGQWPDDKGFLGKPMDTTGLTHVGAREYDPTLGRFISVDPLMDLADAQQMHGYNYGNNNPVTRSDPTGLSPEDELRAAAAAGFAAAHATAIGTSPSRNNPISTGSGKTGGGTGSARGPGNPLLAGQLTAGVEVRRSVWEKVADNRAFKFVSEVTGVQAGIECWESRGSDTQACIDTGINLVTLAATGGAGKAGEAVARQVERKIANEIVDDVGRKGDGLVGSIVKSCGLTHSFVPDTKVQMADGSTKPIQDIQPGDNVLATDPETGESNTRTVLAAITTENDKDFVDLTVSTDDGNASIIATISHPFWVPDLKRWVNAGELKQGQWLQTSSGTWVQIRAVRLLRQQQRTHDLTVDADHTYYVLAGNTPVLVLNDGGSGLVTVGRWMSTEEYQKMLKTGMVQSGAGDRSFVVYPASSDGYISARPGSVYVEFDVPHSLLSPGGRPGDYKLSGPTSLDARLAAKKGLPIPQSPAAENIRLGGGSGCP